ncbi:TadE family protein [Streptomyces boninensis]|uniref:TadE family protein n=1 Tax=Streptomyces boninensis TaxID=2039455 RepID=UPI003B20F3F0
MQRTTREGGSATVELIAATPLLVLIALVVIALGRLADARLLVGDTAHQAARAASLAHTAGEADTEARKVVGAALNGNGPSCRAHHLALSHAGLRPGTQVRARLSCTVAVGDLIGSGFVPGTTTITGTSVSPVDTFRSQP